MRSMFSFEGNVGRGQFWCEFIAGFIVICMLALMTTSARGVVQGTFMSIFTLVVYIPLLWWLSATAIKRCNDLGVPGWYIFIPGWNIVTLPFAKGK